MRAIQITAFGGPEVLSETVISAPKPTAGQVAIEVEAAGVNFAEILIRKGMMPGIYPPIVPGLEVAGRVCALGEGVHDFTVGTPVAAFTFSGYAQTAVVDARLAVSLAGLTDSLFAATIPCAAVTAYLMLERVARLREGEDVLIHGAAGGVGSMAVQIARALGARRVFGTIGNSEKSVFAADLGYDHVIERANFGEAVSRLTQGRGVDVVLEMVGGDHVARSIHSLAPGGRVVYFGDPGFTSEATVALQGLRSGNHGVLGFSLGALCGQNPEIWRPAAENLLRMIDSGHLRSTVTEIFPLSGAADAHERLESGQTVGKLVLRVPSAS